MGPISIRRNIFETAMDLLSQIEARKKNLRATKTILTNVKGERYEIFRGNERKLMEKCLPYVVDDKPDMQIARIIDGLFLSSQDPVTSIESLKNHGIRNVLSLGIKIAEKHPEIDYYFVDFLDLPEFDLAEVLKDCFRIIHNCKKKNLLVHCNAGVSRSATVVIAYLMATQNLSYDEAYETVKRQRNSIKPNEGFVRQLKTFANLQNIIPDC